MLEKKAASLSEIEAIVKATFGNDKTCFRGQSDAAWSLVPTVYRTFVKLSKSAVFEPLFAASVERDTYKEFSIAARRDLRGSSLLEQLSIDQHHGVPTRLLDWSLNALVATYFAVSSGSSADGALWVLNLSSFPFHAGLGRQLPNGGFTAERIENYNNGFVPSFAQPVSLPVGMNLPLQSKATPDPSFVMWKPARLDERLQRQAGLLSWFHTFDDSDLAWDYSELISSLEKVHGRDLLLKITIPTDRKSELAEQLFQAGITAHHLFADLDGLGRDLAWLHNQQIEEACGP